MRMIGLRRSTGNYLSTFVLCVLHGEQSEDNFSGKASHWYEI